MADNNININVPVVEKSLDLVKGFLDKLVGPALDEIGELIADPIRKFRFKNQIATLLKANQLLIDNGINPKTVSLKNVVPLLEGASLEEEAEMQDKWAAMLVNYADPKENFETNIFPSILSKITMKDIKMLEYLREKMSNAGLGEKFGEDSTVLAANFHLHSSAPIANLLSMGLIDNFIDIDPNPFATIRTKPYVPDYRAVRSLVITDLGVEFLSICTIKKKI